MEQKEEKIRKINILLRHYSFDEICEIMGYDDESNETVATDEMKELEKSNYQEFVTKMLEAAIINGNFEEVIENDVRLPI
jgi:hypothetical protein